MYQYFLVVIVTQIQSILAIIDLGGETIFLLQVGFMRCCYFFKNQEVRTAEEKTKISQLQTNA